MSTRQIALDLANKHGEECHTQRKAVVELAGSFGKDCVIDFLLAVTEQYSKLIVTAVFVATGDLQGEARFNCRNELLDMIKENIDKQVAILNSHGA